MRETWRVPRPSGVLRTNRHAILEMGNSSEHVLSESAIFISVETDERNKTLRHGKSHGAEVRDMVLRGQRRIQGLRYLYGAKK